tara:strand:- start:3778 stop:4185 length:408 start_codon:yes stop_codon:yes gene_type:complete
MKVVMCFGSFDYVHKGHKFFLNEAKKKGDKLIVVIARDETIKEVKGNFPFYSDEDRLDQVKNLGVANKVVLGRKGDKYKLIEEFKPAVICLGYDQVAFTKNLKEELRKRNIKAEIIRLPAHNPEQFKSSKLRPTS